METYPISPEDCLLLTAFTETRSLREAARLLRCDPTGLQRKVQRLARDHGLLAKVEGSWTLTASGRALAAWTDESIVSQKRLLLEKTTLRISTTGWFSEQVIIPSLSDLGEKFGEDLSFSIQTPESGLEQELVEGRSDFVIVCHPPEDPAIAHRQIAEEKWVAVVPSGWLRSAKKTLGIKELVARPFVRHRRISPDLLLDDPNAKMGSQVIVDHMIGVRAAVVQGLGWSLVPELLVRGEIKTGTVAVVDAPIAMDRKVSVWWLRSRADSRQKSSVMCAWLKQALL